MKFSITINKDGTSQTEVLERQEGEQCVQVRQIAGALGDVLTDEVIGPECDTVYEREVL